MKGKWMHCFPQWAPYREPPTLPITCPQEREFRKEASPRIDRTSSLKWNLELSTDVPRLGPTELVEDRCEHYPSEAPDESVVNEEPG